MNSQTKQRVTSPLRIGFFAHLALGTDRIDGQIYRSRLLLKQLQERLPQTEIQVVDTGTTSRKPISSFYKLWKTSRKCSDLVIMPNTRGLKWFMPIFVKQKKTKGCRIHFMVVGGWLPRYLKENPRCKTLLEQCDGIYLQTQRMHEELRALGIPNLHLLPNFRSFNLNRDCSGEIKQPFRLVYLSRMLPEKGPQLAIKAVEQLNESFGCTRISLDLWGPIQSGCDDWFHGLLESSPEFIQYKGVLKPDQIPETLPDYDGMVFPTYYSGEGFPGVVLDAGISGLPLVASHWQDNAEFVQEGETGLLFKDRDLEDLKRKISWLVEHPNDVMRMKKASFENANRFHVDQVIPPLLETMGLKTDIGRIE